MSNARLITRLPLPIIAVATLSAAGFPEPTNTETRPGSPMPAEEVAARTPMPEGFEIGVFASEPRVQNPIDCSWDSKGRMWVAENYTYERLGTHLRDDLRDRVILLRDTTGDGRADERLVFTDTLLNLTSLEWTPAGLWVMCPPRLLFIPDEDRDAVPDGPPEAILDGFTVPSNNHHNFANGLRIGPDGWLYGRCGGSAPGEVGQPGTPEVDRIPLRGGIWRYHRTRGTFEVIASGSTNPWGHDWDEGGNLFFINTVNDHLFHAVAGMRVARRMTASAHPRVYETIAGHADHWHFDTKGEWHQSRDGAANDLGGGHAHVGMMIYQGTNWPAEYRGRLFTINLHGRRINQEILKPKGSGFTASHGKDLFVTPDPFFRGIELTQGPHGEVYVLDWSDTGECHEHTGVHRTSGRIYRITYGESRSTNPEDSNETPAGTVQRIRSLTDHWPLDTIESKRSDTAESSEEARNQLPTFVEFANESSPVRLQLASTLQRLPFDLRKDLALALVSHSEDADDPNLPLLVWYGLIPVADHHPEHLVEIFAACEWQKLRQFIARRLTEELDTHPDPVNALLRTARLRSRPGAPADIITGMSQALTGWIRADAPPDWPAFKATVPDSSQAIVNELDSLFGDGRSLQTIETLARNGNAPIEVRKSAVRGLIRAKPDQLKPILLSFLKVRHLNTTAAKGLAGFDDPDVARQLIQNLRHFHSTEQDKILAILCSRPTFASVLLDQIKAGKLPAKRLSAFQARQIDSLGDETLSSRLRALWGTSGLTNPAKAGLIVAIRTQLTPASLAGADLKSGAKLYESLCSTCHKLHGRGGTIGPDLTGGGRSDLDYLLQNIIDPSADVAADYRMEIFTLVDGRVLTGVARARSPKTLTISTMTDLETIERSQIKERKVLDTSLMPEGLLNGLTPGQTRDLFAYLMRKEPVAD